MSTINVTGRKPTLSEVEQYSKSEIQKKGRNKNELVDTMFFFGLGITFLAIGLLVGLFQMNRNNEFTAIVGFFVAFIGLIVIMVILIEAVGGINRPALCFSYFWEEYVLALKDGDFISPTSSKTEIRRITPVALSKEYSDDDIIKYVSELRGIFENNKSALLQDKELIDSRKKAAADEAVARAAGHGKAIHLYPESLKKTHITVTPQLGSHVNNIVKIEDNVDNNPLLSSVTGSIGVEYHISFKIDDSPGMYSGGAAPLSSRIAIIQYFIKNKNGKWFPFDLTPQYEVIS